MKPKLLVSLFLSLSISAFSSFVAASEPAVCGQGFEAICTGKKNIKHEKVMKRLYSIVSEARQMALTERGYSTWRDFVSEIYKESGIEEPKFSLRTMHAASGLSFGRNSYAIFNSDDFDLPSARCEKRVDGIIEGLAAIETVEDEKTKDIIVKLMRKLVSTVEDSRKSQIEGALNFGKQSLKFYNALASHACEYGNEIEKAKFCEEVKALKISFLNESLDQGLDSTLPTELKYVLLNQHTDHPEPMTYQELTNKIKTAASSGALENYHGYTVSYDVGFPLKAFCEVPGYRDVIEGSIKDQFTEQTENLMRSKQVVDFVYAKVYEDGTKLKLDIELEKAKEELITFIKEWDLNARSKRSLYKIVKRIQLAWPNRPLPEDYEVDDKTGLMVLKNDEFSQNSDLSDYFSDNNLSFVKMVNAFYMTRHSYGKLKYKSKVHIMPYFMERFKEDPTGIQEVLFHEIAHSIDPVRVKYEHVYGIEEFYSELEDCYADKNSFRMEEYQFAETFSDYIAAELTARRMGNKVEVNNNEVKRIYSPSCEMEKQSQQYARDGSHPEFFFRISAIALATPTLREKLGCTQPQKKFQNCSLRTK